MLIHITPRIYQGPHGFFDVELVDVRIDQFGLHLRGGVEVAARKPYPNKQYHVACKKVGQKAICGILLDVGERPKSFVATTRWAVNADRIVVHRVEYVLLDEEFDTATDNMILWHAMSASLGGWSSRWPKLDPDACPANAQPRMDILPPAHSGAKRVGEVADTFGPDGLLAERAEVFRLPTIERERFLSRKVNDRLPSPEMAFSAHGSALACAA